MYIDDKQEEKKKKKKISKNVDIQRHHLKQTGRLGIGGAIGGLGGLGDYVCSVVGNITRVYEPPFHAERGEMNSSTCIIGGTGSQWPFVISLKQHKLTPCLGSCLESSNQCGQ